LTILVWFRSRSPLTNPAQRDGADFSIITLDLGVPFLIYTGFGHAGAFRSWPEAPVIARPVESRVLIDAVAGILN